MGFNFYLGAQETQPNSVSAIDLANPPVGAVRLMTNFISEIPNRGSRSVAVWNAGMFPIPCLKTQAVSSPGTPGSANPPANTYRGAVKQYLDLIAPVGGPQKCEVFEVGNEPSGDLAFYLDCLVASYDLIRARGLQVMLGAMTGGPNGATYTPPGGTLIRGSAAVSRAITNGYRGANWSMIDAAAIHTYADAEGSVVNTVQNHRNLFPVAKSLWLTEAGWASGSGGPFTQSHSEPDRINHILNLFAALKNRAEDLNLHGWSYFAHSDYGTTLTPGQTGYLGVGWDGRCGLVDVNGVKKSGSAVTRPAGSFGAGQTFTRSWDAMRWASLTAPTVRGVFPIGDAPPPPPDPPPPPPTTVPPVGAPTLAPARLLEAVRKTHTLSVKAEVMRAGEVIAELEPTGGSVTYDSKASIRATCDLTVVDDGSLGWIPNVPADALAPYGNEIRVSRGVQYDDGTEDLVSLGVFRINEVEVSDSGELRVSGADRAVAVSDAKFEEPHNVSSGTLFTDAILRVVTDAIGGVQANFVETSLTTPGLVAEEGEDRWEFVSGLAQALGAELYFDETGALVLAPIPEATQDPVAELIEGEDGVLLEVSKRWSRTDAFNVAIVSGENSDVNPPVRWKVEDENVLSPTYAGPASRFGRVVRFYSNQYVTTQSQAQDTAEGILRAELGVTQQIDFGAVVNPTLRASDVVLIRRARLGISEAHVIDQLTIPLDAEGSMQGTTRLVYPLVTTGTPGHLLLSPETLLFPEQVLF